MAKSTKKSEPAKKPARKKEIATSGADTETAVIEQPAGNVIFKDGKLEVPAGGYLDKGLKESIMNADNRSDQPATDTPAPPPKVSYEIVEAHFKKELSKNKYEVALQNLTSYKITEENMDEAQKLMKEARIMLRKFDDIKKALKARPLQTCRWIDNAYNSLKKPLEDELAAKQKSLNDIAADQARKKEEADKDKARILNIKNDIDNTLLNHSQAIASAVLAEQLVTIEKMLGSQKSNKSRFGEFLQDFIDRAGELTPQIKNQKQAIKDLEELEEKKKKAEKENDDATIIELEEKKDLLQTKIEENKVIVQESMINQAIKPGEVTTGQPVYNTIGARRTAWKAALVTKPGSDELDPKELKKAFDSGLLKCEINPEKTKVVFQTLKDAGALKDKTEIVVNGIRYYEEKIY